MSYEALQAPDFSLCTLDREHHAQLLRLTRNSDVIVSNPQDRTSTSTFMTDAC